MLTSTLEIIPHVYQITIRGVNIILIAGEEMTLVDTGFRGSSSRILKFLSSLGRSPEEINLIILTHNHPDHIGGLSELKQHTSAKVAAHKDDIGSVESQLSKSGAKQKLLRLSALKSFFTIKPDEVDIQLEGGEVFKLLGGLRVIHTPGHTPGSICLFSEQKKLIIVGDTINTRRKNLQLPPQMVSSDLTRVKDSVKGLIQLDFDILCSGHGRPLLADARTKVQELINKNKD